MNGSKIDNLIKLKKNKINIPNFKIIKFSDVFKDNELSSLINNKKLSNEQLNELLTKYIDENIRINFDLEELKGEVFSVRSSCNIEDGVSDSFAGQFDTYLNINKQDINTYIIKCFKSMFNINALDYINEKNIDINELKMNVIVQEMVNSDYSGVIFSANPQGILNETVIVVGKGLGDNVVSDKIDTTCYYYNLDDNIYYYEGNEDYLSKKLIDEIITISKKTSLILNKYIDIEFAIENNKLYILQARNITTLKVDNPIVLDNSNIVESYPGISLPLTISFVKKVYTGIFKQVSLRILKNKKDVSRLDEVLNNMTSSVNGRLYYKISNWYNILILLPFSNKIIPVWQEMLGVRNKKVVVGPVKYGFIKKTKIAINFINELKNSQKNMNLLNNKFIKINEYFNNNFNDNTSREDIIKLYNKLEKDILSIWDITLVNDMYAFIYTSLLKSKLKKKYENYEEITNNYISGITNIESIKPVKSLLELALLKDKISNQEYNNKFDEYIRLYGDRNVEELKIESKTYRSNPELLEDKIEEYLLSKDRLEKLYNNLNSNKDLSINEDKSIKKILSKVKFGITNREVSRLNRSRIYGMVRSMILRLGVIYTKENLIDEQRDIFYLTLDEIFNNDYCKIDYRKIIIDRKLKYELYKDLPNYSRLVFTDKEFDKNHVKVNNKTYRYDTHELRGIPCSSGVVKAKALVVTDPLKIKNVKDRILITKMTDPGWVFLLTTASGIISEKGSLLSHTAIISRELNIPSIVNVENVMSYIKTDDLIEMDGNTGIIKIIKKEDNNGNN